jgi:uncharacterized protein YbjQ (UPF0145 family)
MIRILRTPLGLCVFVAMLIAACATTELTAVWKDPSYQKRPAKIMVIGVSRNPVNRRIFEDEFVAQLKARGTGAIASYTVLPDSKQANREDIIAAKVKEMGADAILITRLVSKKIVQTYVPGTAYAVPSYPYHYRPPPAYSTWPNYYGYGYRYMYTPGYIAEDEYAVIESNLYEAKSDKLVWAASSETGINNFDKSIIDNYIKIMVENMESLGLVGK